MLGVWECLCVALKQTQETIVNDTKVEKKQKTEQIICTKKRLHD